jgi:molybdopterin synthase sulfur carrier subunit
MKVKLYAMLRSKVGLSLLDVATPPGATVRHVLDDLTARYPALRDAIWDKTEASLVSFVHVLVNGRDVHYLSGLDTPLQPDDAMDIFPPVGGGS